MFPYSASGWGCRASTIHEFPLPPPKMFSACSTFSVALNAVGRCATVAKQPLLEGRSCRWSICLLAAGEHSQWEGYSGGYCPFPTEPPNNGIWFPDLTGFPQLTASNVVIPDSNSFRLSLNYQFYFFLPHSQAQVSFSV